MKVGDLVKVNKSDSHPYTLEGKRGLITELIDYTRYSTAKPKAVPSAIVLFATGTLILPLWALSKVEDACV
jgi:hypothetical protein